MRSAGPYWNDEHEICRAAAATADTNGKADPACSSHLRRVPGPMRRNHRETAGLKPISKNRPYARSDQGKPQLRRVLIGKNLRFGLVVGFMADFAFGFVYQLWTSIEFGTGILSALVYGLVFGIAFGLVSSLAFDLANAFADPDSTSSPSPSTSWRNDRRHAMAIGLVVGLTVGTAVGTAVGLTVGTAVGLTSGLTSGLIGGLVVGLVAAIVSGLVAGFGMSHAWPTTLAAAQLAMRWHTPMHLMNFLDDARERNVLRTVGPVYQFRHARLQDRLTAVATIPRVKELS